MNMLRIKHFSGEFDIPFDLSIEELEKIFLGNIFQIEIVNLDYHVYSQNKMICQIISNEFRKIKINAADQQ